MYAYNGSSWSSLGGGARWVAAGAFSNLSNVSGLATDAAGNIYVVEGNHDVKVFNSNGTEITAITAGLNGPVGVAVH